MEKSSSLTYKILLHKEPEGSYTVTVPALPGCITYGDNIDHAIEMAKEAVELYIAELKATGQEIPDDSKTRTGPLVSIFADSVLNQKE